MKASATPTEPLASPLAGKRVAARPASIVRWTAVVLWLCFIFVLVEGVARSFWKIRLGMNFFDTRADVAAFYPELRAIFGARPSRSDDQIDVLLLGASAIHNDFGVVQRALTERLVQATRRPVRVFSVGVPAHTSLDSYYKYRALATVGFDVVVDYDGFNEVRANNVPPALFREDYSHFGHYQLIGDVLDRGRLWPLASPYTAVVAVREFRERIAARRGNPTRVPRHLPDSSWMRYGSHLRSPRSFQRNLEAILSVASTRGEPVVLATTASYFAPKYTAAKFAARELDYTTHQSDTGIWGSPENVAAGVAAHNATVRALVAQRTDVGFVDMESAIPRSRTNFNDACHLTIEGAVRFANVLAPAIVTALESRPSTALRGR